MGSITLTKAKGIWQTLPVPLRGAATLLAVLALAALLDTGAFAKAAFLSGRSRPGAVAQWVTL